MLTLGLLLASALVGGGTEGRRACTYVLSVIHFTHVTGSGYLAFWSNCQFLQGRVDALWAVESYLDNGLMCFRPTTGLGWIRVRGPPAALPSVWQWLPAEFSPELAFLCQSCRRPSFPNELL